MESIFKAPENSKLRKFIRIVSHVIFFISYRSPPCRIYNEGFAVMNRVHLANPCYDIVELISRRE